MKPAFPPSVSLEEVLENAPFAFRVANEGGERLYANLRARQTDMHRADEPEPGMHFTARIGPQNLHVSVGSEPGPDAGPGEEIFRLAFFDELTGPAQSGTSDPHDQC
ncbi:hypothetical protein AB2N04_00250 (plasmid) [Nitratireductor sp. GISD-1A_MAKvit]|uniref:hypothetical protein n=1 Tax=Nitratireductor sp. GISD-1A_MAKvit TaxID=3234198 RepID=UPI0034665ADC